MTMSTGTPRRSSSGSTVAQLPASPTDSAFLSDFAARHSRSASPSPSATTSRYRVSTRRASRAGSTSMTRHTPSFSVTASGCAPPIPPHPPVTVSVPARVPPNRFAATAANVS